MWWYYSGKIDTFLTHFLIGNFHINYRFTRCLHNLWMCDHLLISIMSDLLRYDHLPIYYVRTTGFQLYVKSLIFLLWMIEFCILFVKRSLDFVKYEIVNLKEGQKDGSICFVRYTYPTVYQKLTHSVLMSLCGA